MNSKIENLLIKLDNKAFSIYIDPYTPKEFTPSVTNCKGIESKDSTNYYLFAEDDGSKVIIVETDEKWFHLDVCEIESCTPSIQDRHWENIIEVPSWLWGDTYKFSSLNLDRNKIESVNRFLDSEFITYEPIFKLLDLIEDYKESQKHIIDILNKKL